MKAFIIDRYKSKDGGRIGEMPEPELLENDMLVQIHAAGVNLLDSKIASGEFKLILPYKTPFVLGHDVAGVVLKVGPGVRKFTIGDEVYARPADYRTLGKGVLRYSKPKKIDFRVVEMMLNATRESTGAICGHSEG